MTAPFSLSFECRVDENEPGSLPERKVRVADDGAVDLDVDAVVTRPEGRRTKVVNVLTVRDPEVRSGVGRGDVNTFIDGADRSPRGARHRNRGRRELARQRPVFREREPHGNDTAP